MTSGIIQILVNNAAVQALARLNQAGDKYKVYPVRADQKEKAPYITVWKSSNDPVTSTDKTEPSHLDYPQVTVSCYSTSFREGELMAEAVRNALDYKSLTSAGYDLQKIWLVNDRDGYDPEANLYVHQSVFSIELKRNPGSIYEYLQESGFTYWGGLWVWADHGNALPTEEILQGKIWVTSGDRGVPGDLNFIPDGTLMTATIDGANSFDEFNFNLA